jgi:predicted DNA-binding protein (MmcQ/YjbR family)
MAASMRPVFLERRETWCARLNAESARRHLLALPEAWEDHPFGGDVAVFKVVDKMFATLGWEADVARMNLKCNPDEALFLRDMFDAVVPGYHMNKTHWNTVILNGSIPEVEIERMMDRSYSLVVNGLKRSVRDRIIMTHGRENVYR